MIKQCYDVALCNQLQTSPTKGTLIKRDITRMLTSGTELEEGMLSARRNNWLAVVFVEPAQGKQPTRWSLASADVNAGEVQVCSGKEQRPAPAGGHRTALGSRNDAAGLVPWCSTPKPFATLNSPPLTRSTSWARAVG